jgi:hypothetical protein
MAYTTIDKPQDYFETTTYAGGTTAITSLNFSPDWVWAKKRTGTESHGLFDSVRGATKDLRSDSTNAESTRAGSLTSFDSNGWSMGGADGIISSSGNDYVAWSWRGSDSSAVSNTDGSITSTVSANTTSGFSIVSYTGTGANATVGHGLGEVAKCIIIKNRDQTDNWAVGHTSIGFSNHLQLNVTDASTSAAAVFNSTAPTSTVFSVGTNHKTNASSEDYIAYCFAEKKGYSKFGSYTGNGSSDGAFVYTGFKPAMLITKRTDSTSDWRIWDNKRDTFNLVDGILYPSASNGEGTETFGDFLSNSFKIRTSGVDYNGSGNSYIYMAFAENPFVTSTGIPGTAR